MFETRHYDQPIAESSPLMMATDPNAELEELRQWQVRVEELEQQLLLSQKMSSLGEISASVTHEFNNILTTIINYAKLGLRHKDPASRDKAFDKILSASQRAAKITTGMLSYARARGDRREPHNLTQLVKDVLVLVEKDLQVHRISCQVNLEREAFAQVNAGQIQQVLLNLIVNARQAMRPGGTLSVSVTSSEDRAFAEVSIADTGSGIPAEVLPRIFDRFFTTKSADDAGQGGTGLGLALCRDVVEAHHGRIRVETAVGHGTKFTLKFPLVPPPSFSLSHPISRPERDSVTQPTPV